MANTTLTQTGAQVQTDLDKVEGLANIKTIGSGLSLSSAGELTATGGSSSFPLKFFAINGYSLKIYKQNEAVDELKAIYADFSQSTLSTTVTSSSIDLYGGQMPIALKIKADTADQLKITCNFKSYYLRYGNQIEYGELDTYNPITFNGNAGGTIEVVLYPLETMNTDASVTIWYHAD